MSEFSEFSAGSQAEAFPIFGTVEVTIGGETYDAVMSEFTADRERELASYVGNYAATAVIQLADLEDVPEPLELEEETLTVNGRTYKIDRAVLDETSLTLLLMCD